MFKHYCLYRTAHGVFKEAYPGEFTAFILPPEAPKEEFASLIKNGIIYTREDALHIFHWGQVFELIRNKGFRSGTAEGVLDGDITGRIKKDDCFYCENRVSREEDRCRPCNKGLSLKYRKGKYDVENLESHLKKNHWESTNAVVLHYDEVFVRMRSKDIAEGRLRERGDNLQGYNPLNLTFDRDILKRNEKIFNAQLAKRSGRMKELKFRDE